MRSKIDDSEALRAQRIVADDLDLAVVRADPPEDALTVARIRPEGRIAVFANVPVHQQDDIGGRRFERALDFVLAEGHQLRGHQVHDAQGGIPPQKVVEHHPLGHDRQRGARRVSELGQCFLNRHALPELRRAACEKAVAARRNWHHPLPVSRRGDRHVGRDGRSEPDQGDRAKRARRARAVPALNLFWEQPGDQYNGQDRRRQPEVETIVNDPRVQPHLREQRERECGPHGEPQEPDRTVAIGARAEKSCDAPHERGQRGERQRVEDETRLAESDRHQHQRHLLNALKHRRSTWRPDP